MAISILGPLNDIIYKTTTEILNNQIPEDVANVVKTLVDSSVEVIDDTLKKVQDLTRQEEEKEKKTKKQS